MPNCDFDIIYFNFLVVQKANRSWTIMGALTALFGITMALLGLQWKSLQIDLVENLGNTNPLSVSYVFGGLTSIFVFKFLGYCGNILADGILTFKLVSLIVLRLCTLDLALLPYVWSLAASYFSQSLTPHKTQLILSMVLSV